MAAMQVSPQVGQVAEQAWGEAKRPKIFERSLRMFFSWRDYGNAAWCAGIIHLAWLARDCFPARSQRDKVRGGNARVRDSSVPSAVATGIAGRERCRSIASA